MAELLVTVAVIGIMAAVGISSMTTVREGSKQGIAQEVASNLNRAVADYSQINWEIDVSVQADETDEVWILQSLQWRDPTSPSLGSPYMNPGWNAEVSSDATDHRIQWNGGAFELINPGAAGTGLRVNFEGGTDMGTSVVHPDGFYPVGPATYTTIPTF